MRPFKHLRKNLFENGGIFIREACEFCQLWIDCSKEDIGALVHPVLHAHGVGRFFAAVSVIADTFRNLCTSDIHCIFAKGWLNGDWASDSYGDAGAFCRIFVF